MELSNPASKVLSIISSLWYCCKMLDRKGARRTEAVNCSLDFLFFVVVYGQSWEVYLIFVILTLCVVGVGGV